ncbi:MAG TPA: fibrobacter succinogenes major paralogous domain-containing protein [Bacteroidales bacterium]|nr:fibrobacter succinogenes major paralogous domain-containing protein [Bacteroidales bacterium]
MKSQSKVLLVFLLIIAPGFMLAQTFVYLNDTAFLELQGMQYGSLQWQQSADTITWTDITGATSNNFPLVPSQSYFYRAKVNSGTCLPVYSDVTKIDVLTFHCGDTLIDFRDGRKYPTVQIGSQCWIAKNLDVGQQIVHGTKTQTNNDTIEKYCPYNDADSCEKYGGLYTWDEMMEYTEIIGSRGICPCGWHVPSDQEWIDLEITLGMDQATANLYNTWRGTDQGTKLKIGGSSGYEGLLSGCAIPGGYFSAVKMYEYMHSSTPYGIYGWRRCLRTGDATVGRWNTFPKSYGLSVRCIKNQ